MEESKVSEFHQPSLFHKEPADLSSNDLLRALNDSIDPNTGEQSNEIYDYLCELKWGERSQSSILGNFDSVSNWNLGDGREFGAVVKHEETGKFFMNLGTYSS